MSEPKTPPAISIEPTGKRVRIIWRGRVIADSLRSLTLREGAHADVQYVPREDVDMTLLSRTAHESSCPWKGKANYFSIRTGDAESENAVWTYEQPIAGVAAIRDHLAFYPSRVDAIEVSAS